MNSTTVACSCLPVAQSATTQMASYASAVFSALIMFGQWFAKQGFLRRWWLRRKGHLTKSEEHRFELQNRLLTLQAEAADIKFKLAEIGFSVHSIRVSQSSHSSCPPSPNRDDAVTAALPPAAGQAAPECLEAAQTARPAVPPRPPWLTSCDAEPLGEWARPPTQ